MPTAPPQRAPWGPWQPRPPDFVLRPLAQVREAYLQFMVSVAMMLRADLNLPENSGLVQEDMAQVLELETQLANVRPRPRWAVRGECHAGPRDRPPCRRPRSPRKSATTSLPWTTGWTWSSSRTASV